MGPRVIVHPTLVAFLDHLLTIQEEGSVAEPMLMTPRFLGLGDLRDGRLVQSQPKPLHDATFPHELEQHLLLLRPNPVNVAHIGVRKEVYLGVERRGRVGTGGTNDAS